MPLFRNITERTLQTPTGEDWPAGECAKLTPEQARSYLAYGWIFPKKTPPAPPETPQQEPQDPPAT